ncbi:hypothetical protein BH23GEM6_BH23GEM6_07370 [soil metagenome]
MTVTARDGGWGLVAVCFLILAVGCRPAAPELDVVERFSVSTSSVTLHVAGDGRLWLGEPGRLMILNGSAAPVETSVPVGSAPQVVGEAAGKILARAEDRHLFLFDSSTGALIATTELTGQPFMEPRGRWAFIAGPSGEMLVHETDSLTLISAWGAIGVESTAISGSPEGDRIYQAVASDAGVIILTRDLQTGRILRSSAMAAPITSLAADRSGNLLAVLGEQGNTAILSLRPWGAEMQLRWRERVAIESVGTRIRISSDGNRVAILPPDDEKFGLRVLDAETGGVIGSMAEKPLDAQFDTQGRLLLLYPGEIRILR